MIAWWRKMQRRAHIIRRAAELDVLLEEIEKAHPCPTADCVHFRARLTGRLQDEIKTALDETK